jgi:hypothetical protein
MSDDYINMHKRIAMGQPGAEKHLKKGGKVQKYAKGGNVKGIDGNILSSAQKKPLPKPTPHAIATMKKGGAAKMPGLMIAVGIPKRSSGRGR